MPTLARTAGILAITALTAGAAAAASHNHGDNAGGAGSQGGGIAMDGAPHDMMQGMRHMMQRMHGAGTMGGAGGDAGAMMDRDMMTMMGQGTMDGMPQGMSAESLRGRLDEYDANDDGALSLDEFAGWHAAMMRERTVDRFQHLDSDGDGTVTPDEVDNFAGRAGWMQGAMRDGRPMGDTADQN
ncbi:EF-hand domain-containing protein [Palleronia pelagia]|uniref:EF hand n=1 Tax=Palleronia pelagia TaxID=387096 RepID=A0A1H8BDK4_9RHOB|nr:hypothetical protein [Palleronia pelagia]SEM80529.1 EF hand [Palleronia pelagia]